jgi:hypothetical protein
VAVGRVAGERCVGDREARKLVDRATGGCVCVLHSAV